MIQIITKCRLCFSLYNFRQMPWLLCSLALSRRSCSLVGCQMIPYTWYWHRNGIYRHSCCINRYLPLMSYQQVSIEKHIGVCFFFYRLGDTQNLSFLTELWLIQPGHVCSICAKFHDKSITNFNVFVKPTNRP
jgi:hypothetical protein